MKAMRAAEEKKTCKNNNIQSMNMYESQPTHILSKNHSFSLTLIHFDVQLFCRKWKKVFLVISICSAYLWVFFVVLLDFVGLFSHIKNPNSKQAKKWHKQTHTAIGSKLTAHSAQEKYKLKNPTTYPIVLIIMAKNT